MTGRYYYLIGFLALFCWLPVSFSFSGETALIAATAYVAPAVGIDNDFNSDSVGDSEQNLVLRFPTMGSILCRIETSDTIFEQSFGNNHNNNVNKGRVVFPTGEIITNEGLTSANSCVVTIIYMEN